MDLNLKEVADLLSISENLLLQWIRDGKVPAYQLNQQYRFSRLEIENWLLQQKLEGSSAQDSDATLSSADLRFSLFKALHHGDVLLGAPDTSKEDLINFCMEQMSQRFQLDAGVLTDLFMDRERLMPTGLGEGIAVPHTRDFLLQAHYDVVMAVFPKNPIEFGSLDGKPVSTCFFLFASDDRRHLNLLSKIAHFCSQSANRAFLTTQPSKDILLNYVKKWESSLTP